MVVIFYVNACLMFITYRDINDKLYASLQADFKIGDDVDINKYLVIEMDRHPYGSIHLR